MPLPIRAGFHFRLIALALLVETAGGLWAQQPAPESPGLRLSTHLVQIQVMVRDKHGPVKNLTQDDFAILDGGKPQTIKVFAAEADTTTTPTPQPLPAGTFTNLPHYGTQPPRSVTVVLLDNLNTLHGTAAEPMEVAPGWLEDLALTSARDQLLTFLKQMNPGDRVAIYGLTDQLRVLCDFTCDREHLLAVVSHYNTNSITDRTEVDPGYTSVPGTDAMWAVRLINSGLTEGMQSIADMSNEMRGETTMAALTAIAEHVADIPGRKNLLWLTSDLPYSGQQIARILARAKMAAYPVDARGLLPRQGLISMKDVDADAYARGEIGVPLGHAEMPEGVATMTEMAADTGGRAIVNSNDLASAIRDVLEDSAAAYTLGFYLPEREVDGKFHKLTVHVRPAELIVSYPRGYFAFKDEDDERDDSHNAFITAIRSPLAAAAIPMDVRIERESAAGSLRIVGVVDIGGLRMKESGAMHQGKLDIYTVEQDAAGKVLHQGNERLNLNLTGQQYETYLHAGIIFRQELRLNPGTVMLRVLVQMPQSAEVGSVLVPVEKIP